MTILVISFSRYKVYINVMVKVLKDGMYAFLNDIKKTESTNFGDDMY